MISPNHPRGYGNDKNCQITIKFDASQMVLITIEDFSVEFGDPSCPYDYLAIFDGDTTTSSMIGQRLCGERLNVTTYQSTGNAMTLQFHTDASETRKGFKIFVDSVKSNYIISTLYLKEKAKPMCDFKDILFGNISCKIFQIRS